MLLPAYLLFQLIPLPLGLLAIFSPARASLTQAAAGVLPSAPHYAPISIFPPAAVLGLFSFLCYLATFLLVRDLSWRLSHRRWIPSIPLIVIAFLEAAIGLIQVLNGSTMALGTYQSHDHYPGLLEMILPFPILYGLALIRRTRKRLGSVIAACGLWAIAVVVLSAIVYSLSRGAFLVTLAMLFFVLSLSGRQQGKWRWISLAAVGAALALLLILVPPAQLIYRFGLLNYSDLLNSDARAKIYSETLLLIKEFLWFGTGLGGFDPAFLKYQNVLNNLTSNFAHNDYLQFAAELGIIRFAILAVLVGTVLVQIFRGILNLKDETRRPLVIACAGSFVAILLHSLVDFNMYVPANAMTLAWIAGIGSANALE